MNNKKIVKIKESPEFWYNGIMSLPEDVRATVAKVVWWDHFAMRLVSERWNHLDEWIDKPAIEISAADWVKHLIKIGYTDYEAATRCIEQRQTNISRDRAVGSRTADRRVERPSGVLAGKVQNNNESGSPVLG